MVILILMINLGLWSRYQYLNAVSLKAQISHYFTVISGHMLTRAGYIHNKPVIHQ